MVCVDYLSLECVAEVNLSEFHHMVMISRLFVSERLRLYGWEQ